ncbi:MAG: Glycosyl transferase family 2 [Candidatus Woesebacteria bacterium GW2011_GWA1_33_30]|uniref:Glycosyl transferase family 2 n=1 Tax=Candidatus Woesebacteria bacterium GW2011_GWA2_33_28 TaxID=1618561 RepID=A0A0F9ZVN9_9BACT|nr:MAG: Glycosyl transferase family 2 [Candidatus Woesebacteria bacterium GW2011_GWA2_33_28]KKP49051.1 MAG: Glycosyl transferase family 2 [Candidatus Woesebacteria bacterium GW2011_GWA1_33_30]KKP49841.1 MAG: Glycosyl transferase family 2 [Microgenomates group bacterium GW2011_GWC1_33_32]KKP52643.1 MAG: Glycosyl transferase family 2 [Candidatus Woesebacteria bacterium GW2011_GWB1_33_38]KKP58820.1 MAG: Glycosyl transferase family 2 [Microgenomates group bacterium GW2011_GWD1_33_9]
MVDEKGVFMVKVSIIILTTNALDMTKEELKDIAVLNPGKLKLECIVVDNNSSDDTERVLKNYSLPNMGFKFIQSGANRGYAGGNNYGIKDAIKRGADYILLLNNDVIVPADMVTKMVDFMEKTPKAGIVSPKMYFAKGYEFHKDKYKNDELGKVLWYAGGILDWDNIYSPHRGVDEVDVGQYDKAEKTDFANGATLLIKREVFEKVGLLDPSFFLYWEDPDFSMKAKAKGFETYYFPGTCMWHKVSASTGGSGSPTNDYFLTRNRLYFAMRYAKVRTKIAVIRDCVRLIFKGRTWQKWGAIDALLGRKGMGQWQYR